MASTPTPDQLEIVLKEGAWSFPLRARFELAMLAREACCLLCLKFDCLKYASLLICIAANMHRC
jgi:hypothetical protein